jgi:hypothetical protein
LSISTSPISHGQPRTKKKEEKKEEKKFLVFLGALYWRALVAKIYLSCPAKQTKTQKN